MGFSIQNTGLGGKVRFSGLMSGGFRAIYSSTAATVYLLDTYPNAAAAYSLRKLRTAYTGSAIRVRRDFDNAEQDIGFTGGNLDTGSLQNFVGYQNLILQSQQFNISWTGVSITIGVDTIETLDPIGTNTSDKFSEAVSTNVHLVYQSGGSTTGLHTMSVYAKKGAGRDWIRISHDGGSTKIAYFNIALGTIGTVSSGLQNANIQSVGNGWYRCSVEITNKANTGNFAIGIAESNGVESYLGSASNYTYFWGAQLNAGTLQTYSQTTTVARTASSYSGFVTTWYDQSGNVRNATKTTATRQPMIVNAGVVVVRGSKPYIQFKSFNDNLTVAHNSVFNYSSTNNISIFSSVAGSKSGGTQKCIVDKDGNTNGYALSAANATGYAQTNALAFFAGTTTDVLNGNRYLVTGIINTVTNISVNGTNSTGTGMSTSTMTSTGNLFIGNDASEGNKPWGFNGWISEVIIYNSNKASEKSGIESNINSYYSIY